MTPITKEMYEAFDTRTKEHIEQVKYFGKMLGYDFEGHDSTKWDEDKIRGFILSNHYVGSNKMTDVEDIEIKEKAIFAHVKKEPHHPAYWDDKCTWERYSLNPIGFYSEGEHDEKFFIDATKMDKKSLVEMCADWCSVSDELGNTPHDWADKNIDTRWIFSDEQKKFIYQSLDFMWDTHMKNKETINVVNMLAQNKLGSR